MSKRERSSKGFWVGLTCFILIAAIVVGVFGIGTMGFKDWSFSRWFPKSGTEQHEAAAMGGTVINGDENNGIALLSMEIPVEEYAAYGISAQAETATVVTATFTPEEPTDKEVTWSCDDTSGKVIVLPVDGNSLQATVTVLGAFNKQVTVMCTSHADVSIKATLTVDWVKTLIYGDNIPSDNSSIRDSFDPSYLGLKYGDGTLFPTTYSGKFEISFDNNLFNFLKSRGWKNILHFKSYSNVDAVNDVVNYTFDCFLELYSESEKANIYSDIANYYYGQENVNVIEITYDYVYEYYSGVETAFHDGPFLSKHICINSFSDIAIRPESINLDKNSIIVGSMGVISANGTQE